MLVGASILIMKRFVLFLLCGLMVASCTKPPVIDTTPASLSVSSGTLSFTTDGASSQTLSVTASTAWTATVANGGSWCSVDPYHGTGNATVTVSAATNKTAQARTTTITFNAAQCNPVTVTVNQVAGKEEDKIETTTVALSAAPREWDKKKRADITYQVNVYSFADSDGDGWGDLKGVAQKLDYFESLGVSALWLSPVHPSSSYHGYDVSDYTAINPKLGTEADFKDLVSQAKAKGIGIYMDFVLNHTGQQHEWFKAASADPASKYRGYYVTSESGESTTGGMGDWYSSTTGNIGYHGRLHFKLDTSVGSQPKLTVTQATEAAQNGNTDTSVKWFIYDNNAIRMYKTGDNLYEITLNIDNNWGILVKDDATQWDDHKWGAKAGEQLVEFGKAKTLVKGGAANDIIFGGSSMKYYASFDRSMPDLYYGPADKASESAAFKDLAVAADKWIQMGVAGLRLDAVIWIYQNNANANVSFLKQWYDRCNTTWKANGGTGDFYMVGEAWTDSAEQMAPYYKGLPSNFNFYWWYTLKDRIGKGQGNDFAKTALYFRNLFQAQRDGFIDAIKLSNHDEDRAAEDLGRSFEKERLAAAVLLTSPGKPYIYQGEELGYWGKKTNGDEYVRAPIRWERNGKLASGALGGKVDANMLSADRSVEAQAADKNSLLSAYRSFAQLRNNYAALASGTMAEYSTKSNALAVWTLTGSGEKLLVVHNFSSAKAAASFGTENITRPVLVSGSAELKTTTLNGNVTDRTLSLGAWSSVVFDLSE